MRLRSAGSCAAILLLASCAGGGPTSAERDEITAPVSGVALAQVGNTPGCRPDDKLLGRFLLSTADGPFTWWGLTKRGFDAAGLTDYKATIEAGFGQSFPSEADAIAALVEAARPVDVNGNNYICAYNLRGTRAFIGDPNYAYYFFLTYDDNRPR
jgi:hypothetical protein